MELPQAVAAQVRTLWKSAETYFTTATPEHKYKSVFKQNAYVRSGYYRRADMGKELFQVRVQWYAAAVVVVVK